MIKRGGFLLLMLGIGLAALPAEAGGCNIACGLPDDQRDVDMTISKSLISGPGLPGIGDTLIFEVRVENLSDNVARCVWITETLPQDFGLVDWTVTDASGDKDNNACCEPTLGGLLCTVPKFKKNNVNNPKLFVLEVEAIVNNGGKDRENTASVATIDNDTGDGNDEDVYDIPYVCHIKGTGGADNLFGTSGNDVICGRGGDDQISGLGGDDCILGGSGDDDILGGPGEDFILGQGGSDNIHGEGGADILRGGGGRDDLNGGDGADTLIGGGGGDLLIGGDGGDDLHGGGGNDVLLGGPGGDTLNGGGGNSDNCSAGGQGGDVEVNCEE